MLSLPEVIRSEGGIVHVDIPKELAGRMTSYGNNYVLFNKRDLLSEQERDQVVAAIRKLNLRGTWTISLNSGEGTREFMQEFEDVLRSQ